MSVGFDAMSRLSGPDFAHEGVSFVPTGEYPRSPLWHPDRDCHPAPDVLRL